MALVIFKLIDKRVDQDSFFQNSDGTKDHDKKLDFTNTYGILNPFFAIVKEGENVGERVYYRYIKGSSIFSVAEQEKQKLVYNMANSLIQFEKGADIIIDDIKMKPLVEFLRIHVWNPKSKYHDPEIHEARFFEFDPAAVRKETISSVELQDKATDLLRLLRNNEERMFAVALLFDTTSGLEDKEDVYLGLREIALSKPGVFMDSIASKEKAVLSDVLKAIKYGIIDKNVKEFFYTETEGPIFETAESRKKANGLLASFLATKSGDAHYRNILIKIEQKEVELNAPA
jgi:hypothetical protein